MLVIDASQLGRACMALVVSVLHQRRALPLAWLVVKANKGHLSQELPLQLLEQVQERIGSKREVIFLGDGEFDGIEVLSALEQVGWEYVCRTAKNARLQEMGTDFSFAHLCLQPGDYTQIAQAGFTQAG